MIKIGIIGLPQSGKSTLFSLLLGKEAKFERHRVGKWEFHLGTIEVPEPRLKKLSEIFRPHKTTPVHLSFVDIFGGIKEGEDIAHIRDTEGFIYTLAVFADTEASKDFESLETELLLRDMETIKARVDKLSRDIAKGRKEEEREYQLLRRCQKSLEEENPLRNLTFLPEEETLIRGYQFLSIKPVCVVANIKEEQISNPPTAKLKEKVEKRGLIILEVCAKLESEIAQLEESEQEAFLKDAGITEAGRNRIISACLKSLKLISFFTVVGDEVKAWAISEKTRAPAAAGCVHSDMEKGFIRAEVIGYEDFITLGSFARAKEKGLLRLEGKDYIIQDGDIINFKFSV
jgi:hypothetical protein